MLRNFIMFILVNETLLERLYSIQNSVGKKWLIIRTKAETRETSNRQPLSVLENFKI
jgi:hypothetical protein